MAESSRNRAAVAANSRLAAAGDGAPLLDQTSVLAAYARWAPIYDYVFSKTALFGRFFDRARVAALEYLNSRSGSVLEMGVGTGIALSRYGRHLRVTGIDLSPDMLAVARRKVEAERLDHVEALLEMDAARLEFPDASFDTVAVMFTITVMPHPDRVMAEVERVLKPGGEAVILSHFASDGGWRRGLEAVFTPLTSRLGWRPDFPVSRLVGRPGLQLVETRRMPPLGIFSMVRLKRV